MIRKLVFVVLLLALSNQARLSAKLIENGTIDRSNLIDLEKQIRLYNAQDTTADACTLKRIASQIVFHLNMDIFIG